MLGNLYIFLFFAVLIGIFIIIIFGREDPKEVQKRVKYFEEQERKQGIISKTSLIHLNGHPYLQPNDLLTFHIRKNNTIYFENNNLNSKTHIKSDFIGNEVRLSQLIRYEVKTEKEIRRDVTLTRLVTLGIFAFGAKKKTEENTHYLILTYLDNGIEITCALRQMRMGQELGGIVSTLNRMKIESNNVKKCANN